MCGRFTQITPASEYARTFRARLPLIEWSPRYNLSPGQQALVVLKTDPAEMPPEIKVLLWGLIPHWAKERGKYSTINARIETVNEKPAFRESFRHKRCIVPADGYFEWQPIDHGKQPYYFHRPDDKPLAFAGLWDTWTDPEGPEGETIQSFTIIVRPAISGISEIHDRMPAILPEELWGNG